MYPISSTECDSNAVTHGNAVVHDPVHSSSFVRVLHPLLKYAICVLAGREVLYRRIKSNPANWMSLNELTIIYIPCCPTHSIASMRPQAPYGSARLTLLTFDVCGAVSGSSRIMAAIVQTG